MVSILPSPHLSPLCPPPPPLFSRPLFPFFAMSQPTGLPPSLPSQPSLAPTPIPALEPALWAAPPVHAQGKTPPARVRRSLFSTPPGLLSLWRPSCLCLCLSICMSPTHKPSLWAAMFYLVSASFQDLLPVRGCVGQLHAQLSPAQPGHPVPREDLHDCLSLHRGERFLKLLTKGQGGCSVALDKPRCPYVFSEDLSSPRLIPLLSKAPPTHRRVRLCPGAAGRLLPGSTWAGNRRPQSWAAPSL